ncbi:MAG: hypothetical protein ACOY40_05885 [Bacillota bacterium]
MPVETEKILAMRCPECGRLEYHRLQRFAVACGKSLDIKCSCGSPKLAISTRNRSDYRIRISCVYCDGYHSRLISGKQIWSSPEVIDLLCYDTGLELGHIGRKKEVEKIVSGREKELEVLVNEFGRDNYFHNSKIMYEVLQCLHQIAEKGTLYCQCGNHQIGVDIFPDRLELHCSKCDSVNIIYAETEDDLQVIQQVEEIELVKNGFEYLDSLVRAGKTKKSPGRKNKQT